MQELAVRCFESQFGNAAYSRAHLRVPHQRTIATRSHELNGESDTAESLTRKRSFGFHAIYRNMLEDLGLATEEDEDQYFDFV